jgi:LEA14-like dessication related protein
MKKIKNTLKIVLVIILLNGCNAYKSINITGVDQVEFKGMIDNKISLLLKVPIENPNWYRIRIKSMDFNVTINGAYLGKMRNAEQIIIPGKSDTLQTFPVDIYVKNLFGAMSTLNKMRKSKSVEMQIEGDMKVRALLTGKTIKVSEKQRVSL